jgi:hypothetical protein
MVSLKPLYVGSNPTGAFILSMIQKGSAHRGGAETHWSHNPKNPGSKPDSALFLAA